MLQTDSSLQADRILIIPTQFVLPYRELIEEVRHLKAQKALDAREI